ncbi:tRNA (adenine(22)-N(1))-methyltransferase TrmK [Saccharospirillum mangrovi]|uniref:tRNA (adenine(22)-N(1))-methyltransferase TrmK n=1 Tax=Saccharospirillum mangrovi TaxID=2161747 RepID=UPI0013006F1E|nr:tRNA (adenine(22)-N(1))-methyltransferase TrmK [Saccharospirillum mangrovi]
MKTRLGKRLRALFEAIPEHGYDSVWDLCCDHGRLGMALLETDRTPWVHFNDSVPGILIDLEERLRRYGAEHYQLHTGPAEALALPDAGKHLLVLAGVGDELTVRILQSLSQHKTSAQFDWLLMPTHNLFQVRQFLIDQNWGLLEEGWVFENGRGYEWLRVTPAGGQRLENPAPFWDARNAEHRQHLTKLLKHARQQQRQTDSADAGIIAQAYAAALDQS